MRSFHNRFLLTAMSTNTYLYFVNYLTDKCNFCRVNTETIEHIFGTVQKYKISGSEFLITLRIFNVSKILWDENVLL